MGRTKSRPRPLNKHKKFLGLPSPRHRLEKRNIYKLCISKLARIDDPQAKLCKAVLINNTLKNLEKQPEYPLLPGGSGADDDDDMTEVELSELTATTELSPSFSSVYSYLAQQAHSNSRTDEDTLSLCDDIISEFLGAPEECQNASNFICDKKRKIEDDKENFESQKEEEQDSGEAGSKSVSSGSVSPYSYSSFLSEVYSVTLRKMKYKVEL